MCTSLSSYRNDSVPPMIRLIASDRFIDETLSWGSIEQIAELVQAHLDVDATHVYVQPVNPNGVFGDPDVAALEALPGALATSRLTIISRRLVTCVTPT